MNKPKVSIIVPVFNVEKYFKRCMDSILNQTLKEIEIILVDDGSPDNCPIMCDEYAILDPRIKVIHKKNGGLGFARNSGLEIATGEYVAFVDSDDYVNIFMFEKLYETAKEHLLDTVYCGFNNVDQNLKVNPQSEVNELAIFSNKESIKGVLLDMIGTQPNSRLERKYRMSVWHGIYSLELINNHLIRFCSERSFISEDIIFHLDYLPIAQKIAFIPDPFYYYCINEVSLTKTFREDRFEKDKILYKEIIRRFAVLDYDIDKCKRRANRAFIGYTSVGINGIANASISFSEKKRILTQICNDEIWELFKDYPYPNMPFKHSVIMTLIRYKMIILLLFVSKRKRVNLRPI